MAEQSVQEELQAGKDKEKIMDMHADLVWYAGIVHFLL